MSKLEKNLEERIKRIESAIILLIGDIDEDNYDKEDRETLYDIGKALEIEHKLPKNYRRF